MSASVPPVDWKGHMRVGAHGAMTGKVLGDRRHPGLAHPREIGRRQGRHRLRIAVKGAVPDDLAQPIVQVHAGGEAEIDPDGPQLGGHAASRPSAALAQPLAPILIEPPAEQARRRAVR